MCTMLIPDVKVGELNFGIYKGLVEDRVQYFKIIKWFIDEVLREKNKE